MHLLAVSAGGGLLVGVGVRLAKSHPGNGDATDRISPFLARLESLEKKIALYAPPAPVHNDAGNAAHNTTIEVDRTSSFDELGAQIAAMEKRLRQDLEQRHEERLDQLSDGLERRLAQRIAPIEAELDNQRVAVGELRDFSFRTETSLQKLLEGIEKLVTAQTSSKPPENPVP